MLEEMIAKKQQLQESSLLCVLAIGPAAAEFEKARAIRRALCVQMINRPRRCSFCCLVWKKASRFCLHKDK